MKRHGNTLYVTTDGAYVAKQGESVVVRVGGQPRMRLPAHTLDGIVCLGRVGCSPAAMAFCAARNLSISFLSTSGRFQARVIGATAGNVLLRREQYRRSDDAVATAAIARAVVTGKLVNCRTVVQRVARDRPDAEVAERLVATADYLTKCLHRLDRQSEPDAIRGTEGDAARAYFESFDWLMTRPDAAFKFERRSRRPPLNPTNALLSFLYTLLLHDVRSALETVGLDPAVGYLHRDRPGRPGLALDLMEELRPFLADRLALALINRRQVQSSGFQRTESGAVMMDEPTRRTVIVAWQNRKGEELQHPFLGEKVTIGLIPHLQARLLARHLRGDLDAYPPFFWR